MSDAPHGDTDSDGTMQQLTIRQRLIGATVLTLLLFGIACLTSIISFENVSRARAFNDRINANLSHTAALGEAVLREESALRGYALSGAQRYLDTLNHMRSQVEARLDSLADGTGKPRQLQRLARIEQLQGRWSDDVAKPLIALVQQGNMQAARERMAEGDSLNVLDPVREIIGELRASVQRDFDASAADVAYQQERARWILIGVLVFGLLLGLVTVRSIVRRVTTPLRRMSQLTQQLADGDREARVDYQQRSDEVGAVARSLERFRQILIEQDRQAWIRDNRARITMMLQQCKTKPELGDRLLRELAALMGAGYGAFFVPQARQEEARDDETFVLRASYAYAGEDLVPSRFRCGEGLVGEVAATGKRVLIRDVPDHYLPVRSGTGHATPSVLLLAPATVNDQVQGIVEFALFAPPRDQDIALLETLLPNVALSLLTLARTRRTQELLDEARKQAEALRQSEQSLQEANAELRMQSEELNTQSEELRASEEELRVQAEELKTSNEELRTGQEQLREQQQELVRLQQEAEQRADELARANQYKSEFLANMSHELRTPLNSLLILSRSLADNENAHLDEEEVEAAGIIHESGSNLLALINDILDLSKIEAGKMQVVAAPIAPADLADRMQRQFAHMARGKQLEFSVELRDGLPKTLVTDAGKLEQIVRNLVSNAIKFTERGAVSVEIAPVADDVVLRNGDARPADMFVIHVRDNGIGIPADRLEQIFEAFEQVDTSTSRKYGGTGLGLSISRELAQLLGGEMRVDSTPDEGSRFSVYLRRELPVADDSDDQARADADLPAPSRNDAREHVGAPEPAPAAVAGERECPHLLIIDDDERFTRIVAEAARKHGFVCSTAVDGEQGLNRAAEQRPDAIVLDLGLPGIDGWQVLDRLKQDPATRAIPVHIVSAADDDGNARRAGAVGFLQKPISREQLDMIFTRAEALSGREARRILVIDDDRDAHTVITHLLKHEAVEIVSAGSGEQAKQALADHHYDCVVLDLKLPDISGFDLLEQITSRRDAPPVVVYSARDLSEEQTRRLRAHTDSIVIKGERAQERLLDEISLFFHHLSATTPRQPAARKPPEQRVDSELAGTRVLLVDDDMRNTFALSRVLRARGLTVLMASDGHKALDQLAANDDIAIVLMDIMMPGMDGYETIRRIRGQNKYAQLPIIALTAKAMAGDREKCLEAGADGYLPKPLDTEALLNEIRALL